MQRYVVIQPTYNGRWAWTETFRAVDVRNNMFMLVLFLIHGRLFASRAPPEVARVVYVLIGIWQVAAGHEMVPRTVRHTFSDGGHMTHGRAIRRLPGSLTEGRRTIALSNVGSHSLAASASAAARRERNATQHEGLLALVPGPVLVGS